jgi:uncharacterized protein (DUF1501 family)
MRRRDFLSVSAGTTLLTLGSGELAATGEGRPKRLIVIFLRGAVDGLNVVVPYGEKAYYDARPTIAIARAGTDGGALPLDDRFGLHPALASLLPLWSDKTLAFVHAAGSPDATRSHFDAQLYVENGTPGRSTTADGWMNRLLATLPEPHGPTDAVSIGPTLPQILKGKLPVANLPLGPGAGKPTPIDRPEVSSAFDQLYARNDAMGAAYRQARAARAELIGDLATEMQQADNGAPPPNSFPAVAARLAHLITQDRAIRLAFASLGGWDTHVNQGNQKGQLANRLRPLGDGLAALVKGLGKDWGDTIVVILSEFGRTVHENGSGGTDHGHGNIMFIMGGGIKGGKVYGDWPGLAKDQLYGPGDLGVTTDFRDVLAEIVQNRLLNSKLAEVFPGYQPKLRGLTSKA